MDIKSKSHILKKRANELGYDIKLTHAQEMVSALFGHESRHSALLSDKHQKTEAPSPTSVESISNVNQPVTKDLEPTPFLDPTELSFAEKDKFTQKVINLGKQIGHKYGKKLIKEFEDHMDEYYKVSNPPEDMIELYNKSLLTGIVVALTRKLDLAPMRAYFYDLRQNFNTKSRSANRYIGEALYNEHEESRNKIFDFNPPEPKKKKNE